MTAVTNLYAKYKYKINTLNQPIVVLMHGWLTDTDALTATTMERLAAYGFFVMAVGMRSRNNALPANVQDASGIEVYDIYDAVVKARLLYPTIASQDKVAIVGYSAGGGNALALACKMPDFCNVIVANFGISDYGRDATDGWYQNNDGTYTASIATWVGGVPGDVPNNYYARDAVAAIANYSGGFLYLYHDKQDTLVPWVHSNRIKAAMDTAVLTNYSANFSDTGDATRYTHGVPDDNPGLIVAEPTWAAKVASQPIWTIPAAGTITVIGYIKTKLFTIWLNAGLDAAATVVYDTVAGTYTVTPLTSNAVVAVTITQGALTASGNTDGATLFTVA